MSPLRARFIEDMILAGLAEGTRQVYTRAVYQLAAQYRRSPDQLIEEEVRSYLLGLRQRGVARGTFKIAHFALRFLYLHRGPVHPPRHRVRPTELLRRLRDAKTLNSFPGNGFQHHILRCIEPRDRMIWLQKGFPGNYCRASLILRCWARAFSGAAARRKPTMKPRKASDARHYSQVMRQARERAEERRPFLQPSRQRLAVGQADEP